MQSSLSTKGNLVLVELISIPSQAHGGQNQRFGLPGRIIGLTLWVEDGATVTKYRFRERDLLPGTSAVHLEQSNIDADKAGN